MATKVTVETKAWSTDSATLETSWPGYIDWKAAWLHIICYINLRLTYSSYVPTADQINSPVPITQIPQQARSLLGWACTQLVPVSTDVWSSSDRVAVELIGYWSVQKCYPDHTRSIHDHLPINPTSTWQIPDHFLIESWALASSCLLDRYSTFFDSQK